MRIVVVGAGAAGCMAAIHAAGELRRRSVEGEVLLLERTKDGGRKILISGGGRCNILPAAPDYTRFITDSSPNTMRNILRSWPHHEQVEFFNQLGLDLVIEEESGKLFPRSNRARDVRDGLIQMVGGSGGQMVGGVSVQSLARDGSAWKVKTTAGTCDADAVILATGGLSVPQTGSDGTGLAIARELGHEIHDTYPALTPLTTGDAAHHALAGISAVVTLRGPSRSTATGGFLFTHRGYSGPAVLDLSHLVTRWKLLDEGDGARDGNRPVISAQWSPLVAADWDERLRNGGSAQVSTIIERELPVRLADLVQREAGVDRGTTVSQLRREERRRLVEMLTAMPLPWDGDEGYRKAEVTGGGVSLADVDPRTLESRKVPGLYLVGEMLDTFGPIGGYNFLWAWVTGRAAGRAAAARTRT